MFHHHPLFDLAFWAFLAAWAWALTLLGAAVFSLRPTPVRFSHSGRTPIGREEVQGGGHEHKRCMYSIEVVHEVVQ